MTNLDLVSMVVFCFIVCMVMLPIVVLLVITCINQIRNELHEMKNKKYNET
jgi:hypothetical protein